jgi:hypothetical protein
VLITRNNDGIAADVNSNHMDGAANIITGHVLVHIRSANNESQFGWGIVPHHSTSPLGSNRTMAHQSREDWSSQHS